MKSRIKGKKIYRRRNKSKKRIAITADHAEIQGLTIIGRNRFYYEKIILTTSYCYYDYYSYSYGYSNMQVLRYDCNYYIHL